MASAFTIQNTQQRFFSDLLLHTENNNNNKQTENRNINLNLRKSSSSFSSTNPSLSSGSKLDKKFQNMVSYSSIAQSGVALNSKSNTNSSANENLNANTNANTNSNTNANTNVKEDSKPDTKTNPKTNTKTNSNANSNAHININANSTSSGSNTTDSKQNNFPKLPSNNNHTTNQAFSSNSGNIKNLNTGLTALGSNFTHTPTSETNSTSVLNSPTSKNQEQTTKISKNKSYTSSANSPMSNSKNTYPVSSSHHYPTQNIPSSNASYSSTDNPQNQNQNVNTSHNSFSNSTSSQSQPIKPSANFSSANSLKSHSIPSSFSNTMQESWSNSNLNINAQSHSEQYSSAEPLGLSNKSVRSPDYQYSVPSSTTQSVTSSSPKQSLAELSSSSPLSHKLALSKKNASANNSVNDDTASIASVDSVATIADEKRPSESNNSANLTNNMQASSEEDHIPTAIVIKNIPFAIKKEQLLDIMIELALPIPYAFNYHFDNGIFRGLAFANFTTPEETAAVIQNLNGHEISGRKLRVEYKKMLPLAERERIEREKREKRGQLEEQHRQNQNNNNNNSNINNNNSSSTSHNNNNHNNSHNNHHNSHHNHHNNNNNNNSSANGGNNSNHNSHNNLNNSNSSATVNSNVHASNLSSSNNNCNNGNNSNNNSNNGSANNSNNNSNTSHSHSLNSLQNTSNNPATIGTNVSYGNSNLQSSNMHSAGANTSATSMARNFSFAQVFSSALSKLDLNDTETLDVYSHLLLLRESNTINELVYSPPLSPNIRRTIFLLAQSMGLIHTVRKVPSSGFSSSGDEDGLNVYLTKPNYPPPIISSGMQSHGVAHSSHSIAQQLPVQMPISLPLGPHHNQSQPIQQQNFQHQQQFHHQHQHQQQQQQQQSQSQSSQQQIQQGQSSQMALPSHSSSSNPASGNHHLFSQISGSSNSQLPRTDSSIAFDVLRGTKSFVDLRPASPKNFLSHHSSFGSNVMGVQSSTPPISAGLAPGSGRHFMRNTSPPMMHLNHSSGNEISSATAGISGSNSAGNGLAGSVFGDIFAKNSSNSNLGQFFSTSFGNSSSSATSTGNLSFSNNDLTVTSTNAGSQLPLATNNSSVSASSASYPPRPSMQYGRTNSFTLGSNSVRAASGASSSFNLYPTTSLSSSVPGAGATPSFSNNNAAPNLTPTAKFSSIGNNIATNNDATNIMSNSKEENSDYGMSKSNNSNVNTNINKRINKKTNDVINTANSSISTPTESSSSGLHGISLASNRSSKDEFLLEKQPKLTGTGGGLFSTNSHFSPTNSNTTDTVAEEINSLSTGKNSRYRLSASLSNPNPNSNVKPSFDAVNMNNDVHDTSNVNETNDGNE